MEPEDESAWWVDNKSKSPFRPDPTLRSLIGGIIMLGAAYFIAKLPRLTFHTGDGVVTYNRADYPVLFNIATAVAVVLAVLFFASAARMMLRKSDRPPKKTNMWPLMFFLLVGCLLSLASANTGVQSFYWSSRNDTVVHSVTYWHDYWRALPLVYAAFFAGAIYGVYCRLPIAWKLGWLYLILAAAHFIAFAWIGLLPQPQGWIGAIAATVGGIGVAIYWGARWYKQKSYFIPDESNQT
jgi:hypothetical protein